MKFLPSQIEQGFDAELQHDAATATPARSFGIAVYTAAFLVFLFLISFPGLSVADFYRWTDEDGVSHVTDQAPPDAVKMNNFKVTRAQEEPAKAEQPMEQTRGEYGEYRIPFKRAYGGMLVDVMLNDRVPARMIVDTGATHVKINVKLLKKLVRHLPDNMRKGKMLTVAGVVDSQEFIIEKVDLGGAVKVNVPATFSDEAHDFPNFDGLLGLSFLSNFRMSVDYDKNLIHLRR